MIQTLHGRTLIRGSHKRAQVDILTPSPGIGVLCHLLVLYWRQPSPAWGHGACTDLAHVPVPRLPHRPSAVPGDMLAGNRGTKETTSPLLEQQQMQYQRACRVSVDISGTYSALAEVDLPLCKIYQTRVRCHIRQMTVWVVFVMELISRTLKVLHKPEIYYVVLTRDVSPRCLKSSSKWRVKDETWKSRYKDIRRALVHQWV